MGLRRGLKPEKAGDEVIPETEDEQEQEQRQGQELKNVECDNLSGAEVGGSEHTPSSSRGSSPSSTKADNGLPSVRRTP